MRGADTEVAKGARLVVHDGPTFGPPGIDVLYEDDGLVVVNKPAGWPVNETETSPRLSIVETLRDRHPDVFVVHRLDRDTTGVLVFALGRVMAERLSAAFAQRTVHKRYLALVEGQAVGERIDAAIGPDPRRPRARRVRKDGKPAQTTIEVLGTIDGVCAVEAAPRTGRTHQIRVHLAHVGTPLLGDRLYGGPTSVRIGANVWAVERPMLHAAHLLLPFGRRRDFEAPMPDDVLAYGRHGLALSRSIA